MVALELGDVAALFPLGTVLAFAAILLRRWWTQQDNAMAAAIEATAREGARWEQRIAEMERAHDAELASVRSDLERMAAVVRQLVPLVPLEQQTRLWDLMWATSAKGANGEQPDPAA